MDPRSNKDIGGDLFRSPPETDDVKTAAPKSTDDVEKTFATPRRSRKKKAGAAKNPAKKNPYKSKAKKEKAAVKEISIVTEPDDDPKLAEAWEAYRRRQVRHGINSSSLGKHPPKGWKPGMNPWEVGLG